MSSKIKRNVLVTVFGAFLLLMAFPVIASANAAITSFRVDRTSITQGQSVTFSVTTTADVNYVFAEVNGARVQATLQSANTWRLVATPNRSQDITVVASATNSTTGAATVTIPVAVISATPPPIITPPTTPTAPVPPTTTPATPGNMAIVSITETPALRTGEVQLTVVTGIGANEVWVQFDETRFRRAQELTSQRTDSTRTWQIDFRPQRWAVQTVQVSANREYVFAGATNQNYTLTLAAPFVPQLVPAIQSVTTSASTVTPGTSVTFTIRTNLDVNHVWVVDVDGNRRNASPSGAPGVSSRNWTVSFVPPRTGAANVFANITNENAGAATRTEQITVQQQTAQILNPTTARWAGDVSVTGWRTIIVEATTNSATEHAWVRLPNGTTQSMSRTGTGTGNRTWRVEIFDVGNISSLEVHVSDAGGSWTSRDSRSVNITGQQWTAAWVEMQSGAWVSNVQINSNGVMTFQTSHTPDVTGGIQVNVAGLATVWATSTNGWSWTVALPGGFNSNLQNQLVAFWDNTSTGRGDAMGTLRWN